MNLVLIPNLEKKQDHTKHYLSLLSLDEDYENPNLRLTLSKGLECRVLHSRAPPAVLKYLVHLHNRFHQGSSTSFVDLLGVVPDVSCLNDLLPLGNRYGYGYGDFNSVLDCNSLENNSYVLFCDSFTVCVYMSC